MLFCLFPLEYTPLDEVRTMLYLKIKKSTKKNQQTKQNENQQKKIKTNKDKEMNLTKTSRMHHWFLSWIIDFFLLLATGLYWTSRNAYEDNFWSGSEVVFPLCALPTHRWYWGTASCTKFYLVLNLLWDDASYKPLSPIPSFLHFGHS